MTDPADLSCEVLLRVGEFLRKLPREQLHDLASGAARLEVVPKGGRVVRPGAARTPRSARPVSLPQPAERVNADLIAIGDRAAAVRYLDDLGLKVDQLRLLAKELGVAVGSKVAKKAIVDAIVEQKVGRRLVSGAIMAPRHRD